MSYSAVMFVSIKKCVVVCRCAVSVCAFVCLSVSVLTCVCVCVHSGRGQATQFQTHVHYSVRRSVGDHSQDKLSYRRHARDNRL